MEEIIPEKQKDAPEETKPRDEPESQLKIETKQETIRARAAKKRVLLPDLTKRWTSLAGKAQKDTSKRRETREKPVMDAKAGQGKRASKEKQPGWLRQIRHAKNENINHDDSHGPGS